MIGASLLAPFLPETADKIAAQMNASLRDFDTLGEFGLYPNGNKVTETPTPLFARLDIKDVLAEAERIAAIQKAAAAAEEGAKEGEAGAEGKSDGIDLEPKATISYDDFAKMQFQVGEILACEEVKKSKKLLCSQVKVGSKVLQIVSGIKAHYSAEEMVGKKVMVLTNLAPATLAGIESQGMLLCAEDENGELALLVPEKDMPAGAEIC
jgi:methionyl-tRNA synthetase